MTRDARSPSEFAIVRAAVDQLFATYAAALDTPDYELLDTVFSEAAVWRRVAADGLVSLVEGKSKIRDFLPTTRIAGQPRHLFSNLRILGETDSGVSATMYMLLALTADGHFEMKVASVYTASLVLESDVWRIGELTIAPDLLYHIGDAAQQALESAGAQQPHED